MSTWKSKLKGKKGCLIVLVNNMGPSKFVLKSSQIHHGKVYKRSKAIQAVLPSSIEDMVLANKIEGEWTWGLEDDPLHSFKMYISWKGSTVQYEDLPSTSPWSVEVQQEWDASLPQVILNIYSKDGNVSRPASPFSSSSSLPTVNDVNDTADSKRTIQKTTYKDDFDDLDSSTETSDGDDSPQKNKINLVIKDRSQVVPEDDPSELRSAVSRLSLGMPLGKKVVNQEFESEREKRLAQIPVSATNEFEETIRHLENGNIDEASAFVNSALSQVNELAFKKQPEILKDWCAYSQLLSLLCEMQRLENEDLYKQKALLASFVSRLAFENIPNTEHKIISLRMGINRNLEIGNFNTASHLLKIYLKLDHSQSEQEIANAKLKMCQDSDLMEKYPPLGAELDPRTSTFTINGKPYALCMQSMRLIRETTHLRCPYCGATFSEVNRSIQSKCLFCFSNLDQVS